MKKQFTTRGFSEGKDPRTLLIEIIDGNCDFNLLELHCDFNEIESIVLKSLSNLTQTKELSIKVYNKKIGKIFKPIPSYNKDHISLRYFLARNYYPHELLDVLEKTEKDISDLYENFHKSLKPPFDKILND